MSEEQEYHKKGGPGADRDYHKKGGAGAGPDFEMHSMEEPEDKTEDSDDFEAHIQKKGGPGI